MFVSTPCFFAFLTFRVYILEASRTSGDNSATIIVGDAMRGAAWVAEFCQQAVRYPR